MDLNIENNQYQLLSVFFGLYRLLDERGIPEKK